MPKVYAKLAHIVETSKKMFLVCRCAGRYGSENFAGDFAADGGGEQTVQFFLVRHLVKFKSAHRRITVEPWIGGHVPFSAFHSGHSAEHVVEFENTCACADCEGAFPSAQTHRRQIVHADVGVGFCLLFRGPAAHCDPPSVPAVHALHHGYEIGPVGSGVVDAVPMKIQMDHLMYERVFEFGPVDIVIAAHRKCVMSGSRLLARTKSYIFQISETCSGIRDGYSDIRQGAVENDAVELLEFFCDELMGGSHWILVCANLVQFSHNQENFS